MGGDFSWVVKMQKIGVTIKIRNSCMNNSVEALILFNKEHQGLLKLHVHLGWGGVVEGRSSMGGGEMRLCCVALLQGSPVSTGFHLGNFDISYLML